MWRWIVTLLVMLTAATAHAAPFVVEVVDDRTGRGVPMVELRTTSAAAFYTDSAGIIALDEPGYFGQKVHFTVFSFGYDFPADAFGVRGATLDVKEGGSAKLKIKRLNIAERLYRVTGEGIYRDSVLAGRKPLIDQPLLNAQVTGQDSVLADVYRGKIRYFWGDTAKLSYALGNFGTSGAVADLPSSGGLDPSVGVNLKYFVNTEGFSRPMAPMKEPGAVWIGGLMVLKDDKGNERMIARFSRMKDLGTKLEQGLLVYNDEKNIFERLKPIPMNAPIEPNGHPFRVNSDGQEYFYFPQPYPVVRVKADWKSATDLSAYEAYTCLKQGTKFYKDKPPFDRDAAGKLKFGWKTNTPPVGVQELEELVKAGKVSRDELPMRLTDAATNKPVLLHGGSVHWNDYRKKYVMIALGIFGDSMLGEIYFAESEQPQGPWVRATKIVTHHAEASAAFGKKPQSMDFYNPTQHPFYDQDGGRIIYFEGTYTNMFSGNPMQTPRYEYNQIMYRLDLSDPRLTH
jgi:hypothetical protein